MINHQIISLSRLGILKTSPVYKKNFFLPPAAEKKWFTVRKYIRPLFLILFFYSTPAFAFDVTLQWDANSEPNLLGYKVYYDIDKGAPYNGTGALEGASPVDMPLSRDENLDPYVVQFTLHDLPEGTYHFVVTAYNNEVPPLESNYSNEVATTFSPDTTAPVISNVEVATKTDTTAVITWTTDEPSNSQVLYGTISGSYPSSKNGISMVTSHSITLTNLIANTAYYFRVASTDSADNGPTISNEIGFTTNILPETTGPVISNVRVSSKTAATAMIEWTTDEPSDSMVQYGKSSSNWGSYSSNQSDSAMVTNHSVTLSGLNGGTTYYFRVGSNNAVSNDRTISNELSFTTNPIPDTDPPFIIQFPIIDYANDSIYVTFSESNMSNATKEVNYLFNPSLLFKSLSESDDIVFAGNNTYRLSMASIPHYLIITLTVNNITDLAGNMIAPSSIMINDNDYDGMADDWELAFGASDPLKDADGDGLSNLEEYNNNTNPNDSDTDRDGLPDGWEVVYGLDPIDNTGLNGNDGDPDNDGWTNYEEYLNGYNPSSDTSYQATPPEIKKTIPKHNSGITNRNRIPDDTSFAVQIRDFDGIDITDATSVKFTINDGMNPVYQRDLNDKAVVRVVKLASDPDSQVTNTWVVYDRSLDSYGNFPYDADVIIKVDAKDRKGAKMQQATYAFNIETMTEYDEAEAKRPVTALSVGTNLTTMTVVNDGDLDGFQVIYDNDELIIPRIEPPEEIYPVDIPGVTPVHMPVKLGPPTVFNNPVTIIMPYTGESDIRDLSLYMYDGDKWVYTVSSFNTGGVIQPEGDSWVVPGSLTYDNTTATPTLHIQVYHFSGIQTGILSYLGIDDTEVVGGCFIDTISHGFPMSSFFSYNKWKGYVGLIFVLSLGFLVLAVGFVSCIWKLNSVPRRGYPEYQFIPRETRGEHFFEASNFHENMD